AVGVDARRRQSDEDVTGAHLLGSEQVCCVNDTGGGTGDIVFVDAEQARVLGGLPSDQGDAGAGAGIGDAADDIGDAFGHDLAAGDVVGHEQRPGSAHDDVVDDHPDEVEADGVVLVQGLGDGDLRAHPIGGGGQQRTVVVLEHETSKSPANPPIPPTTPAVWVAETAAFISSTARSPASTSTPAAA